MRDWSTKQDDLSTVSAEEFNDLTLELENTCVSAGETLFYGSQTDRDTNTHQLESSILKLASASSFLIDSGTINDIKLLSPNSFNYNSEVIDNQMFTFIAKASNDGPVKISAFGSVEVQLLSLSNQPLVAGDITSGTLYQVKTHFENSLLTAFILLSRASTNKGTIHEYVSTSTYSTHEIVTVNGLLYKSLIDSNINNYPPDRPVEWLLHRNVYQWSHDISAHYKAGDIFAVGDDLKVLKVGGDGKVNPSFDTGTSYSKIMLDSSLSDYYTKTEADTRYYDRGYINSNFVSSSIPISSNEIADGAVIPSKLDRVYHPINGSPTQSLQASDPSTTALQGVPTVNFLNNHFRNKSNKIALTDINDSIQLRLLSAIDITMDSLLYSQKESDDKHAYKNTSDETVPVWIHMKLTKVSATSVGCYWDGPDNVFDRGNTDFTKEIGYYAPTGTIETIMFVAFLTPNDFIQFDLNGVEIEIEYTFKTGTIIKQ